MGSYNIMIQHSLRELGKTHKIKIRSFVIRTLYITSRLCSGKLGEVVRALVMASQ